MSRVPTEIVVTDRVRIPASEIALSYARSGGPGGQHVNKTESKVLLRWNARASSALTDDDRALDAAPGDRARDATVRADGHRGPGLPRSRALELHDTRERRPQPCGAPAREVIQDLAHRRRP